MKIMNLKGTFDFIGNEQRVRNFIINTLRHSFEKYGYIPVETPILNHYDLLAYKYNESAEILHEIYKLTDQGERNLGLRYDLTVPFCKVVSLNMNKEITLPFRRYEIGKVFRNGPVKLGRTREFYQCDVDVVGIDNRYIEAEQILMAITTYKELGINAYVKYNNRKLLSGLIIASGISNELMEQVIGIIDKKEKVDPNELTNMFKNLGIKTNSINKLMNLFNMSYNDYSTLLDTNELIESGLNEINELNSYLKELGIIDDCYFTPTLARGLSIYTGLVFEFYDKEENLKCAIGGGGRYDKIITDFISDDKTYPAIGLSFGLEPIYIILKNNYEKMALVDVYMVPLNTNVETLKLANVLRDNNNRVLIEMNKKKVAKCFEYAERNHIPYVMIIGENEINSKTYKIKNMLLKEELNLTQKELIDYLNKRA